MDPREYQKLYDWLGGSIAEGAQEVRRWAGDRFKAFLENNNNNNAGYASTNYPVKISKVGYRQPLPSPKTPSSSSFQIPSLNDLQRQQASILRGGESLGSGGYNAVNQWGSKDGTGNKYVFPDGSTSYVGDFREMPQHAGRDLADLTLSEIKELQYDDGNLSMREWVDQGKLHAVGGHQFIKDTFIDVTLSLIHI